MSDACTWPEQDAVDAWLEKHGIKVEFKQAMELKEAVTAYRIKVQTELDALRTAQTEAPVNVPTAVVYMQQQGGGAAPTAWMNGWNACRDYVLAAAPAPVQTEAQQSDEEEDGEYDPRYRETAFGYHLHTTQQSEKDVIDAARWRALLGSARIRPLGSAGIMKPEAGNYAHLGLELWTVFGNGLNDEQRERLAKENALAREWLTSYADIAAAASHHKEDKA